jgi:transposase
MEILYARCAGLDVHKDTVVACARVVEHGTVQQVVKTFETTTSGLLALAEWLHQHGCTHAAMEATGVYWKPVWHILDGHVHLVLANAMHIRNVPGRKTDVNDAMWIADLLAHGLIRGSFVPEASIQALRMLTRTRKQLVRERVQHMHRIQKTLEDANLKLASIVSDLLGRSSRAILQALAAGEADPEALADLAQGRLKARRASLQEALRGRVTTTHRFLLQVHLDQIQALDRAIEAVEAEVDALLGPFRAAAELLATIPGAATPWPTWSSLRSA